MSRPEPPASASPRKRLLTLACLLTAGLTALASFTITGCGSRQSAPSSTNSAVPVCARTLSGTQTVEVAFDGETYPVRVHVPEGADATTPAALVLDLHGSNSNGTAQAGISGLDAVADADAEGFVVAEPTAAIALDTDDPLPDGNWAWNVPGVPTTAGEYPADDARDDIAFLTAVIDTLTEQACVDPTRVYATGYSGGGRMASALACERPDLIAAIAPVAGLRAGRAAAGDVASLDPSTCTPAQPVSVLTFHGTDDVVNPYDGNDDPRWGYGVEAAVSAWAQLDGCSAEATTEQVSDHVSLTRYGSCEGGTEVELYTVDAGGHTWPGTSADLSALGTVTQEINASQLMWEFFSAHPRQ
ncbi:MULTISPECIES: PHB depolymerase family esterase [unclassified Actinomyces]|uniref:extracellular catalytic domain type 1 short-chain-length polyhydroxyalkanoate depolymerase n=1 Tax=unclassified Actinomyces TaxID=2609248 RepID=UPI001373D6DE|nr:MULTISPECIES: PHB depolymerase family esterase [unclassified Actinomyces]NDR52734.1 prolyl oligopeptidase family serine peptidase [Actinomyces sp. 565]QHO91251.1 alpha/beta hydrolase [Actinomyces sp. 432]